MANRLIIEGDTIRFEGFPDLADNDVISINIFGWNRVVISRYITPEFWRLDCHNIITICNREYCCQSLVDKLSTAGIESGRRFIKSPNAYIADILI